ncbi:ankyrin repeat-containing domain protein [Aspergillus carlsbadensis]|nr:ankyrin repeat-containing domain protein [Aspergillus carlsbadensis]
MQEGWRALMSKVLVVYGPTEFVISKGSEQQATTAVRSWLTRKKRAGYARPGWHIGRQDLLALSIQRGFLDCMDLLLDQFSYQELLSHWKENEWQAGCYPHIAVSNGRTAALQLLHRWGINIDQADWQGRTPLVVAVRESQAQVADYLLSVGVSRDVELLLTTRDLYEGGYKVSLIECAAYRGTLDMVEVLIKHGLYVKPSSETRRPKPLHWVIQRSDLALVEDIAWLILEHTDLACEFRWSGSMLLEGALKHHASIDLIRHLVSSGIPVNHDWDLPLVYDHSSDDLVRHLEFTGIPVHDDLYLPLDLAAQQASEETIRLLIDNGAKCTLDAVNAARKRNRGDLVDMLLPCCQFLRRHTLRDHAINGKVEMAGTYLAYGAELYPAGDCKNILCSVAFKGHVAVCKLLLEAGADINEECKIYESPLSAAIFGHHPQMVTFLLEHGAPAQNPRHDPLLAAIDAYTPRHDPWIHPDEFIDITKAIIRILVDYGVDVNAESSSYGSGAPLHTVVNLGFLGIAECLLENGADVNLNVGGHGTPLHVAALTGSQAMIRLLLKHGAKANITSGSHGRPLQAAIARGSLRCVQLLLGNGAEASLDSGDGYPSALEKARRCWEENQNWKRREILDFIHDCCEERGFFEVLDRF